MTMQSTLQLTMQSTLQRLAVTAAFILPVSPSAMAQTAVKTAPDSSGPQMALPAPHQGSSHGDRRNTGVQQPPSGIDPAIQAPVPRSGTMPVIPPPGTPGGNPNMVPK
jgi:hypothetical protein